MNYMSTLQERAKIRAYYLYLKTGCQDDKHNYFTALAEEQRLQELYRISDFLEAKNKIVMHRVSSPPQKKWHGKMQPIIEGQV